MEREAETVAVDDRRQGGGKVSKKGERDKKTKEWCSGGGTWGGRDGTNNYPSESPPFRQRRRHYWSYL